MSKDKNIKKQIDNIIIIIYYMIIIIAICLLFLLVFINKKKERKEGMVQRGCLILYGEAFREGKQFDRKRDTTKSFENQMKACDSHIKFIEMMKSKNIEMDVSISTYCTKYEKELKEKYANYNLFYSCETTMIKDVPTSIKHMATQGVKNIKLDDYSFVLFTRNDICFKDEFIENFQPGERIQFVSQHWSHHDCFMEDSRPYPVINTIIMYVPKKYYFITKDLRIDHDSWKYFIQKKKLKDTDMELMLDTYHDSDSYKDYNPLYYMVGRKQTDSWYDEGKINENDWDNLDVKCHSYKKYIFKDTHNKI